MIETIVNIIDRLVQLCHLQDERKRRVFSEIIEPTFNDLLRIHGDYMEMFTKAQTTLRRLDPLYATVHHSEPQGECLRKARDFADFLSERRQRFLAVRVKLRKIALELSKYRPKDRNLCAYTASIRMYFTPALALADEASAFADEASQLVEVDLESLLATDMNYSTASQTVEGLFRVFAFYAEQTSASDDEMILSIAGTVSSELEAIIRHLESSWAQVCIAYARLKLGADLN